MQMMQYVSDLGGLFSLWFGFALLAIAELCELVSDLILVGFMYLLERILRR